VKFIKYDENVYYIASISQEGRILLWNPEHKLKYPVIGYCLKHKFDRNILQVNPTVFVDNPFESCDFRVGTYDGSLYKCNFKRPNFDSGNVHEIIFMEKKGIVWRNDVRVFISNMRDKDVTEMKNSFEKICKDRRLANLTMEEFLKLRPDVEKIYKNALKLNYERHFSAVSSINFNYFVKNLIVTTSYDGSLRLYHGDEAGLKYFYCQICGKNDNNNQNEEDYYTYSTWSPYKPNILVAGNSRGEIEFGILTNRKKIYNIATIQDNGFSPVIKIVFNPNEMRNQNILTVSYKDGIIELFKLSDSFSQVGMNEIENLSKYISH
jgi:WD40 repeat protein